MITILYTDTRHNTRIEVPLTLLGQVLAITQQHAVFACDFDLIHIDLRGDVEAADFYIIQSLDGDGKRVASIGGALAWGLYVNLAQLFPEIGHHLRFYNPAEEPGRT